MTELERLWHKPGVSIFRRVKQNGREGWDQEYE
jgi:hypothetical protein